MTAPRRIVVSDGKPRPSWIADDMEELLYEQLKDRLLTLGATGYGCGWHYERKRPTAEPDRASGELTVTFGAEGTLTVTAPTPMDAVRLATRTLRVTS